MISLGRSRVRRSFDAGLARCAGVRKGYNLSKSSVSKFGGPRRLADNEHRLQFRGYPGCGRNGRGRGSPGATRLPRKESCPGAPMTGADIRAGLLTPQELAQLIGATEGTLRNWRSLGKGPPFLKPGKKIFYDRKDVDVWLESTKVNHGANTQTTRALALSGLGERKTVHREHRFGRHRTKSETRDATSGAEES